MSKKHQLHNLQEVRADVNGKGNDLANLGTVEKRILKNQDLFLEAYSKTRTKTTSAKAAGVNRETVRLWERDNKLGFGARLAVAGEVFTDSLEEHALGVVKQLGPKNSPLLLITLLNRHLPHLYRPNVQPTDESSKEVLKEIRGLVNRPGKGQGTQTVNGGRPGNTRVRID